MQPLTRLQAFQSSGAASCLVSCCALAAPNSNGGLEVSDITGFCSQALGSTIQLLDSIAFRGLGVMASEAQSGWSWAVVGIELTLATLGRRP